MTRIILVVLTGLLFALHFKASLSGLAQEHAPTSAGDDFHWNWRDWQELTGKQSLRDARLPYKRRNAIAKAIAAQLRPRMADLDIQSEDDLTKVAQDTRIKMIDLNSDGIPEIVAQAMVNCGATGNCPFWVFRKARFGYELILDGEAQTFTIQVSRKSRFRDVVLSRHGSASSGDLFHYEYHQGAYQQVGCYDYTLEVLEGDKIRALKEPRLTPCGEPAKN